MRLNVAVSYTLVGKVVRIIGMLAILAIHGRYLSPDEIGTFAVIFIAYQLFVPLLEGGLTQSFFKSDSNAKFLGKLHLINFMLALNICLLMLILKPFLEQIFAVEISFFYLLFFCFFILIASLNVQRRGFFEKKKNFDNIFYAEMAGFLVGCFITSLMAIYGFGYVSIIARFFVEALVVFMLYRFWFGLKISFSWMRLNSEEIKLILYGFKIAGSRLFEGLTFSIDRVLVGILFGSSQLGFYLYSKNLASMPDQILRQAMTHPLFSFLSELGEQESFAQLQKIGVGISLIVIPILTFVVCYGDILLTMLMGNAWQVFGDNFRVLGIFGVSLTLRGCLSILFINKMNMKTWNRFVVMEFFCLCALIGPMFWFNITMSQFVIIIAFYFFIFWTLIYLIVNTKELKDYKKLTLRDWLYSNQILVVFSVLCLIGICFRLALSQVFIDTTLIFYLFQMFLMGIQFLVFLFLFYFFIIPNDVQNRLYLIKSFVRRYKKRFKNLKTWI